MSDQAQLDAESVALSADGVAVMGVCDHIEALRTRLIRSFIGIGLLAIIMFWQGRAIVCWLCQPLFVAQHQLGLSPQTVNLSVAGGFSVYVKVSLVAAVALGAPWAAYQLWKFVAPGLHAHERRVFRMLVPYSLTMTITALGFLYYLFLPAALSFLLMFSLEYPAPAVNASAPTSLERVTSFFNRMNASFIPGMGQPPAPTASAEAPPPANPPAMYLPVLSQDPVNAARGEIWFNQARGEIRLRDATQTRVIAMASPSLMVPLVEINEYLGFVLWVALVLVIAFQLPVAMTIAAAMGLLDPKTLGKHRKYLVFGCFALGIIVTPNQDIVSNVVFPVLLWLLFEVGLITGRMVARPRSE